ncbi:hypothetical protein KIL84_002153 [Mauremys mutica]|uniref:Uncharacterized protein n=1 Tax=Mauremys mutica TaxID=74926 RepID=A0A9D3XIH7_9SAUR|nr:hypothetical protein KIL84_002153 [Mauremys mutica]
MDWTSKACQETPATSTENMDFPKLVIDDKILMDILVLALMLIAIGIAFLIYHRKENIEPSKLRLAEIILLIIAVISLFGLNIIGTIFLTYRCADSSQTSLGHLDMPKLVLLFSILLAIATVSLFILIPFLIYYRCCLEKRKRNAAGGRCDNGEEGNALRCSSDSGSVSGNQKTEREDNL